MPHAAVSFRPHHRFAVPLPRSRRGGLVTLRFLAESRNISFPRRCGGSGERSEPIGALMPHAALWVVQRNCPHPLGRRRVVSMPHAALWVVQHAKTVYIAEIEEVSMPHAALWVVQPAPAQNSAPSAPAFQCRTRLCGWCSKHSMPLPSALTRFQCRTRLCGWCSRWELDGSLLCSAVSMPHAAIPFRPHHRFAVPLPRSRRGGFSFTVCRLLSPMRGTRAAAKYRRSV